MGIFHKAKLFKKVYTEGDELILQIRGDFKTNGDCGSSLAWGIDKKTDNGEWKALIKPGEQSIMMCGFPTRYFKNELFVLFTIDPYVSSLYPKLNALQNVKYRLSFLTAKKGKLIHSKTFVIKR